MAESVRPLWATVDLDCIRHNVAYLKGLTPQGCLFMAVVKANAYGHGDAQVSRAALQAGADCLGVALVEEAARLREAGFDCPVYVLFEPPPAGATLAVSLGVVSSVYSEPYARALSEAAQSQGKTASVHVKVDTGMHRVGVSPSAAAAFARSVDGMLGVRVDGTYTHFAVATEPDDPFTAGQIETFERAASEMEESLGHSLLRHGANSAGIMAFPESHCGMVRAGIAMLGLKPSALVGGSGNLRPALTLGGEISYVKTVPAGEGISYGLNYAPARETTIATLPIGYADGLSRLLSGKAEALIGGKRKPVVGTICMDVCMADVGGDAAAPGTPFVIIGGDGSERITAEEVAEKMGTINYEVVCMISSRVPRVFKAEKGD